MKGVIVFLLFFTGFSQAQVNLNSLGNLPQEVEETSGLLFFDGRVITHNDSGNEATLFEIDTVNLSISRTVRITNVPNTDWEALAQDDEYIYIGDFGNNVGIRQDLAIYRILKTDYISSETVTATITNFAYEDQTEFIDNGNSDWDAEAFFVLEEQFVIFTKQWQSLGSVAYMVPNAEGTFTAQRLDEINNIGLLTDASYNPSTNTLVVLGYSTFLSPFIAIITEMDRARPFNGFAAVDLGLGFVQAEGITFVSDYSYLFSSEFYSRQTPSITSPSRLFTFQITEEETQNPEEPEVPVDPENPEQPESPLEPEQDNKDTIEIRREARYNQYFFNVATNKAILGQFIFDASGKQIWKNTDNPRKEGRIETYLENAIYYFTVIVEDGIIAKPFVVY